MTAISLLREEVRKLPRVEQLSLIQYIAQILQEDEDFVLSEAWEKELDRRDELYREGKEQLHSWQEIQNQITAEL